MGLALLTPPGIEPLSLVQAKLHLRVDHDADDALIEALIAAAREHVEETCGRALLEQEWKLTLDAFPPPGEAIEIPRLPLISVDSIQYRDANTGELTLLASSEYVVEQSRVAARIRRAYGATWPTAEYEANAIEVTFTAGYGAGADEVPKAITAAMLLLIGDLYTNREARFVGTIQTDNPAVGALLKPYQARSIA